MVRKIDPTLIEAFTPKEIERVDQPWMENCRTALEVAVAKARTPEERHRRRSRWALREELGPIALDGDPTTARVVHLKANPSFGEGATRESHFRPHVDWPLSVAGPHNTDATRGYYEKQVFRHLLKAGVSLERISQRMAKIELCPWASRNWPTGQPGLLAAMSALPSRRLVCELVRQMIDENALFVIARAEGEWFAGVPELSKLLGNRVFIARSKVAPWISQGAFPDGWTRIVDALKE
jgi:hypothetical protein